MNTFIKLHAADPFSEEDDAFNPIFVRAENIAHIETFMGPFTLQAFGPDGRCVPNGKHRVIQGGLVMLAVGGSRVVKETPADVMALMAESEQSF